MDTKKQNVMRKIMLILTWVLGLFFANASFASTTAKPNLELRNSHVLSIEQSKRVDKVVNLKSKNDTIIIITHCESC